VPMRILSITLIIAIVLAAIGFLTGPMWSFYDLRASAESEDIQSLSKLVDFDSVRAGLKTQIEAGKDGVEAPAPSVVADPAGAAGNLIKKGADAVSKAFNDMINPPAKPAVAAPPPPDPDAYLKPRALLALSYGAGRNAPRTDPKSFVEKPPVPKVTFWSLDRVRLSIKAKGEGKTIFTYERKGIFKWQLVHIGLPEISTAPPPALTSNPPAGAAASTTKSASASASSSATSSAAPKPVAKPVPASMSSSAKPVPSPVE
jgi:hypothetical protein